MTNSNQKQNGVTIMRGETEEQYRLRIRRMLGLSAEGIRNENIETKTKEVKAKNSDIEDYDQDIPGLYLG